MQTLTGRSLKGFELQEEIGAGGTGKVYRAFQQVIERRVAIKVILPKYANEAEFIRRFETEAQTIARLEHPFIVPLYDYWRDPQGAYLVMRWLPGGSLRDLLNEKGAIPIKDAVKYLEQIAAALHIAHKQGVVHRDLKPDNILLDNEQNAYLTDFGIAKLVGETLTSHSFAGTVAYVAPEQITSQAPTPQVDIYSFGIMLYEILTGQHPFPGSTVTELLIHHTHDPLPDIHTVNPELPEGFNQIIQRATAKDPDDRYENTRDMMEDIYRLVRGSAAVASSWSSDTPATNPYKGLRAFKEIDAADFFGRDALVSQMIQRLRKGERFLAVVGPSGSGKSSAVHAGLVSALRRETLSSDLVFFIADCVPGKQPITAIADALESVSRVALPNLEEQIRQNDRGLIWAVNSILQKDNGEVLLIIDQFEEIFTHINDEAEREQLLNSLYVAATDKESRLQVIITLRADFYDRPLLYENFGRLVQEHTQVVLPLNASEIEQAIVGPARRVGLQVDTQLVAAVVADVREEPGALPLLQYALTELFEQTQETGQLNYEAYEQSGGIFGVLAKRANELYQELSEAEQELTREIFLRLVQLGDGTEDTRRRARRAELHHLSPDRDSLNKVLEQFGKARLITFDIDSSTREPMVEVAHEALIRQWGRLREWLDQSRENLRSHYKLLAAMQDWQANQSHKDFLLSGSRLAQFEDWAEQSDINLSPQEEDFLSLSIEERQALEAAEENRRQEELNLKQESIRRLRYLIAAVVIIAVLGILMAVSSTLAFQEASDAQATAEENERIASNAQATAEANLQRAVVAEATAIRSGNEAQARLLANRLSSIARGNPSVAYALAIALLENIDPVPASVRFAVNDLFINTYSIRQYVGHSDRISHVSISSDGTTALSSSPSGEIIYWDIATGEIIRRLVGHETWARTIEFHPDGKHALSASNDMTMILWDLETGAIIRRYEGAGTWIIGAALSPDGKRIFSGHLDGKAMLWDTETGEILRTFAGHTSWIWEVDYSPDGKTALTVSDDKTMIWWDLVTGEQLRVFSEHEEAITCVTFTPDGKAALTGSYDTTLILHDLETGEVIRKYERQSTIIWGVVISPDGQNILSAGEDGSVFLWNIDDQNAKLGFYGHVMPATSVTFAPDGLTALSSSEDGTLFLWDVGSVTESPRFEGHTGILDSVSISPDGRFAVSASWDKTLIKWNIETAEIVGTFIGHEAEVRGQAYSPDGRTIIAGDNTGTTIIWDAETQEILHKMQEHKSDVLSAAYMPDSSKVITTSHDKTMILWDVESGELIRKFEGHIREVNDVVITSDGLFAISASDDATLILWDINTGEALHTFVGHRGRVMGVALAPDEKTMLSTSADGRLILWDIATGETIREFAGHTGLVDDVDFAPDGQTALSTSADGTIILWDVASGEALRRLRGHGAYVSGVKYLPDGLSAISSSGDMQLLHWTLSRPDDELIQWARENRVVAELTCEELKTYGVPMNCDN